MKVGLFFGSFNPIHLGHVIIANFMLHEACLDEVWLVVSPQNPFKLANEIASVEHRINMVNLALNNSQKIKVCDLELRLPQPSYTINSLNELKKMYPHILFEIIMGSDNLDKLHEWHRAEEILVEYKFNIYKRNGFNGLPAGNFEIFDAPCLDISATWIRNRIKQNKNVDFVCDKLVAKYIKENSLYL